MADETEGKQGKYEGESRGWLQENGLDERLAPYLARFVGGLVRSQGRDDQPMVLGDGPEVGTPEEAAQAILKERFFVLVTGANGPEGKTGMIRAESPEEGLVGLAILVTTYAESGIVGQVLGPDIERLAKELSRAMRPGLPAPKVMMPGFTPPAGGYLS